jgi:homoserine O-succinyltransferase
MPIVIPEALPAATTLRSENIFVMNEGRAIHQDIRPLQIVIVNLMPTKIDTETQLLRLIGNTPLQVEVTLMQTTTYQPTNVSREHLLRFYASFDELRHRRFDGMIITGAPVETLPYEEVDYWGELTEILDYAAERVTSTLHICWGAQAALYHRYGIRKHLLPKKAFGVFDHRIHPHPYPLLRGFDDRFSVPHSRHTEIRLDEIETHPELVVLGTSEEVGVGILMSRDERQIYVTGHLEYDPETLDKEYRRDLSRGLDIEPPRHYYPGDDPDLDPIVRWRSHANLLFSNWLNYHVYQTTPYHLEND